PSLADARWPDRPSERRRLRPRAVAGGRQRAAARYGVRSEAWPAVSERWSAAVTLGDLLTAVAGRAPFGNQTATLAGPRDAATVTSVTSDSREVLPGSLFVALRGLKADGSAFARDAIAKGAIAIVAEVPAPEGVDVPWEIGGDHV